MIVSCCLVLAVVGAVGCGRDETAQATAKIPTANSRLDDPSQVALRRGNVPEFRNTVWGRPAGPPIRPTAEERTAQQRMLDLLHALELRQDTENNFYGRGKSQEARRKLGSATTPFDAFATGVQLALAELEMGNERVSLDEMAKAKAAFDTISRNVPEKLAVEMYFVYATAYLRMGETQNCCQRHNQDSCLLPIRGGGIHTRPEGSRMAIEMLKEILGIAPPQSEKWYEAVWLLNIAYMTLGEHPQGVPPEYLIEPDRFLSTERFPRFGDVAGDLGLDTFNMAGSVIADDFNNDGYPDLVVSSWDLHEPLRIYYRSPGGSFKERTEAAGLNGLPGGLQMIHGDYNNDGWLDLFVIRGAWQHQYGRHPDSLIRNNGDGTFTDVSIAAGLADIHYPSQTACWFDFDLDGDLDLFVGGEAMGSEFAPCQLFRNNSDGTFTDVAAAAGVTNYRFTKGVASGDYNGDRFPDIYVSNLGGANRLYRNNMDGTFTDVAAETNTTVTGGSFPTWFWDYDNDGILDIFVAPYDGKLEQVCRYYLGHAYDTGIPHLLRGSADGKFTDMAWESGLREPSLVMGASFGDLDNDGYLDMYLGTGDPRYWSLLPNKMYHNRGGKEFTDISESGGFGNLQKGHGIAFADLDMDGDQDVFIQMGGAYPGDKYFNRLHENPGFGGNWLAVDLVGKTSNRFGVGSRIRAEIEERGETRSVYRWTGMGSSFGGNPLRQHLGLGHAEVVKRLEVFWPQTGETQEFYDVPVNRVLRITEGSGQFIDATPKPLKFVSQDL